MFVCFRVDEYFLNCLVWVDFFHVEVDVGRLILELTSWTLEMNYTESRNSS